MAKRSLSNDNIYIKMGDIPPVLVTVGVASAEFLPRRGTRSFLYIRNTHATQTATLRFGTSAAVLGRGFIIDAGDILIMDGEGVSNEAIQGIASGAGTTFSVVEGV